MVSRKITIQTKMKLTIQIPHKISTNKLSRAHWGTRHSITKKYIKEIKKHKIRYRPKTAIDLEVTFYFENRPLDCTNCSSMVKMIEDALVYCKVLKDDNPKYVSSVKIISKVDKNMPRIEIELK